MKQIKARIALRGGNLLSAANAHSIVARATTPTDRYGNALVKGLSPIDRLRGDPPYTQKWRVKKEPKGFIFREVTNNQGTCGHHKTVRALVSATLTHCLGIIVEVFEDEDVQLTDRDLARIEAGRKKFVEATRHTPTPDEQVEASYPSA